jgi:ATP-binding cassette subfamily F protein 3
MISLLSISKQFGAKIIFNKIAATFNPVHRIGLIGPNGAGKTMLMRVLMGEEPLDGGEVSMPPDLRLGYLPQELSFDTTMTPIDYIILPFKHLLEHHETLTAGLSADTSSPEYRQAVREFDRLQTERAIHDAYGLTSRAKTLLVGLGVPESKWEQAMEKLSGGFRMRVALARLLLLNPDFLLLDEPTNHLDMDSLIWLEKFLQRFSGGMLIISHDRDFLNRITTHTAEMQNGTLSQYSGSIAKYFEWKEEQAATEERRTKNLEDKISQTKAFIDRFKAKNTKATQAHSKQKQLEKLEMELPPQRQQSAATMRFRLPEPTRSGAVPLKLAQLSAGYNSLTVFENLELTITRGDKIAIIGPNGAGKSTLLKICAGQIDPLSGSVEKGANTEIRYYSQHRLDQLHPQANLYDTIAQASGSSRKEYIHSILGAFLFSGDDVLKTVGILSGGEKSRLSLATILSNPGNLLLLDEPTNHLDIQSVERLADALADYEGTLMIVSHDEYFISRIANRVIEMRPGRVRDFPGSPADYRAYIEAGFIESLAETATARTQTADPEKGLDKEERMRRREERKKLERRIEKLEKSITETEQELTTLNATLHDPAHSHDYVLLQKTTESITSTQSRNDELLTEWTELQESLEALGAC